MGTITGRALAAMERAEHVPIMGACPPSAPGWYSLYLGRQDTLLFVGETADLAARVTWHRERLHARGAVDVRAVFVRWVEAAHILGQQAHDRRARWAIDGVLVALLQPVWDSDIVAAAIPDWPPI